MKKIYIILILMNDLNLLYVLSCFWWGTVELSVKAMYVYCV